LEASCTMMQWRRVLATSALMLSGVVLASSGCMPADSEAQRRSTEPAQNDGTMLIPGPGEETRAAELDASATEHAAVAELGYSQDPSASPQDDSQGTVPATPQDDVEGAVSATPQHGDIQGAVSAAPQDDDIQGAVPATDQDEVQGAASATPEDDIQGAVVVPG